MTFVEQETTEVRHRIRFAWSAFAKHRQEPTFQSNLLGLRLHLFDPVVTSTVTCGAGTWATTKEHEKCSALHSTECFDSSSRQRENTNKHGKKLEKKTFATIKNARRLTKKTAHDEFDQDSSISFDDDDEGSTASQEDNLEDWIEHVKSTEVADEQMLTHNAEWNPGLIISTKDSMESRKTSQEMGRRPE